MLFNCHCFCITDVCGLKLNCQTKPVQEIYIKAYLPVIYTLSSQMDVEPEPVLVTSQAQILTNAVMTGLVAVLCEIFVDRCMS